MLDAGFANFDFRGASGTERASRSACPAAGEAARSGVWGRGTPVRISRQRRSWRVWRGPKIACDISCMTTAREETNSTVNQVAKVLTPENKDELLPRFFHLSRRHAELLAVSLRPVEVIPVREVVTAIRPAPAAARAAAITPPAAEAGETRAGGTDGIPLHPGEAAAEMDGSPAADASPFQLHPGEVAAPVRVAVVHVPPEAPRDEIEHPCARSTLLPMCPVRTRTAGVRGRGDGSIRAGPFPGAAVGGG
jgi:hypothetical protein